MRRLAYLPPDRAWRAGLGAAMLYPWLSDMVSLELVLYAI
jgi:hypothetical protein